MSPEPLALRDEVEESNAANDPNVELPSQGSSYTPTILPGKYLFRLPANLDQCWEARDYEKKDKDKQVVMGPDGKPVVEQHLLLQFDAENPLVVVGGDYDGLPAQATITTIPRDRNRKKGEPPNLVHDLTYLVRTSLNDRTPVTKKKEWPGIVNKYAGHVIYLETGLSAQCSSERVRYVDDGAGGGVADPGGVMGCNHAAGMEKGENSRLYTNDFKVKVWQDQTPGGAGNTYNTREEAIEGGVPAEYLKQITLFTDTVHCKGCGARLRGFFRVEKYLPPLASTQQVG